MRFSQIIPIVLFALAVAFTGIYSLSRSEHGKYLSREERLKTDLIFETDIMASSLKKKMNSFADTLSAFAVYINDKKPSQTETRNFLEAQSIGRVDIFHLAVTDIPANPHIEDSISFTVTEADSGYSLGRLAYIYELRLKNGSFLQMRIMPKVFAEEGEPLLNKGITLGFKDAKSGEVLGGSADAFPAAAYSEHLRFSGGEFELAAKYLMGNTPFSFSPSGYAKAAGILIFSVLLALFLWWGRASFVSNSDYQNIFRNIFAGIIKIRVSDGAIQEINATGQLLLGLSYFNLSDSLTLYDYLDIKDVEKVSGALKSSGVVRNLPVRIKNAPTEEGGERWVLLYIKAFPDDNAVCTLSDIHDYALKYRRLSEDIYHDLFILDNLPAPIFLMDIEGQVARSNLSAVAMLGLPLEEIRGSTAREIFPKSVAEKMYAEDVNLLNGKTSMSLSEYSFSLSGGTEKTYTVYKIPRTGMDGEAMGLLAVFMDITSLKNSLAEATDRALRPSAAERYFMQLSDADKHEFNEQQKTKFKNIYNTYNQVIELLTGHITELVKNIETLSNKAGDKTAYNNCHYALSQLSKFKGFSRFFRAESARKSFSLSDFLMELQQAAIMKQKKKNANFAFVSSPKIKAVFLTGHPSELKEILSELLIRLGEDLARSNPDFTPTIQTSFFVTGSEAMLTISHDGEYAPQGLPGDIQFYMTRLFVEQGMSGSYQQESADNGIIITLIFNITV